MTGNNADISPDAPTTTPGNDPDDIPELDDAWFRQARPAGEALRETLPAALAAALLNRRPGRPRSPAPKEAVNIRLDADVLAHYRADGPGWQTRINETLRQAAGLKAG